MHTGRPWWAWALAPTRCAGAGREFAIEDVVAGMRTGTGMGKDPQARLRDARADFFTTKVIV